MRIRFALTLAALASPARADVKLPALFSDGMVLQQGCDVPVWGWAEEGERVTVKFQGQEASAEAKGGTWRVRLKPLAAGAGGTLAVSGKNTIEVKDVLVGEVWVCSGQSNMEWPVARSAGAEQAIADSACPRVRLFQVPRTESERPRGDVAAAWRACGPDAVPKFSAIAYFFGRDLERSLGVPVGLIQSAVGGTPAEAWTSEDTQKANPDFKGIFDAYAAALERYKKAQAEHAAAAEKARAEGRPAPEAPRRPWMLGGLYNGMIAPLQPYAIRGAIWYQGEGNAPRAWQYRALFPAMIRCWRDAWGQGDFPFLFVQLAAFGPAGQKPEEETWPELREAQLLTLSAVPHAGMAVSIDVGDEKDIHPKRKQQVGARLALAARAIAYGEKLVYSGPVFAAMKVEGDKAALSFDHVGGGLEARDGALQGFTIAGEDKAFHGAKAEIEGDRVVVSCPEVKQPAAVRYGWGRCPPCNLYNKEGLPASPFRTDDWPGVTKSK